MYLAQTLKRQLLQQQKRLKSGLTKQVQSQMEHRLGPQHLLFMPYDNKLQPYYPYYKPSRYDKYQKMKAIGFRGAVGFMGGFIIFGFMGATTASLRHSEPLKDGVEIGVENGVVTGLLFAFPKTTLVGMGALYYGYKKAGLDKKKP